MVNCLCYITMSSVNLNILTLNVRGISSVMKREKVYMWCENQNADIILLQETHCTKRKVNNFASSWKGESFHAVSDSPYSKGVSILFRENLNVKINNVHEYLHGRALLLNIEIHRQGFTVISMYAPNEEKQRAEFFRNLQRWINEKVIS